MEVLDADSDPENESGWGEEREGGWWRSTMDAWKGGERGMRREGGREGVEERGWRREEGRTSRDGLPYLCMEKETFGKMHRLHNSVCMRQRTARSARVTVLNAAACSTRLVPL